MGERQAAAKRLAGLERFMRRLVAGLRIPYLKVVKYIRFDPDIDDWLTDCRADVLIRSSRLVVSGRNSKRRDWTRWRIDGQDRTRSFKTKAEAGRLRSRLLVAQAGGHRFHPATGYPIAQ